jgi:hypothetical protein
VEAGTTGEVSKVRGSKNSNLTEILEEDPELRRALNISTVLVDHELKINSSCCCKLFCTLVCTVKLPMLIDRVTYTKPSKP